MNYVKSCLIITMLLGFGYSQCNESNWEEYYPNMAGCYLPDADLSGEDLAGADLDYAILYRANLQQANLSGATLKDANLAWANLSYADLSGANLTWAILLETSFSGADLTGANLTHIQCYVTSFIGALLDNTIFDSANLSYAYFDENVDYYDDVSYDAGAESGDLNLDGVDNVLDVVILVNNILLTP